MSFDTVFIASTSMVYCILHVFIAIRLFRRNTVLEDPNLKWLIAFFIFNSVLGFGKAFKVETLFFFTGGISLVLLALFTRNTFYSQKKSLLQDTFLVLAISLMASCVIIGMYRDITENINYLLDDVNAATYVILTCLSSGYLGISAYKSYKKFSNLNIDDWIRKRYKSIAIASWIYFIQGLVSFMAVLIVPDPGSPVRPFINFYISMNIALIFSIVNFYAWFYLSQKNVEKISEISENYGEEVTEDFFKARLNAPRILINTFGKALSSAINKPLLPSIGLIRQSFKDQFGAIINLSQLKYKDIKNAFEISLKARLEKLHVEGLDGVIKDMILVLDKNKEILTIGVV